MEILQNNFTKSKTAANQFYFLLLLRLGESWRKKEGKRVDGKKSREGVGGRNCKTYWLPVVMRFSSPLQAPPRT